MLHRHWVSGFGGFGVSRKKVRAERGENEHNGDCHTPNAPPPRKHAIAYKMGMQPQARKKGGREFRVSSFGFRVRWTVEVGRCRYLRGKVYKEERRGDVGKDRGRTVSAQCKIGTLGQVAHVEK